jgi:hypothetical protein
MKLFGKSEVFYLLNIIYYMYWDKFSEVITSIVRRADERPNNPDLSQEKII